MTSLLQLWLRRSSLLLLPTLFAFVALHLAQQRGPFWLGLNSDPSYQYLLNSLLVMHGHPPCHVDHPGTTVQVLGAAVLRATTPGSDLDAQTLRTLADPETALAHLHVFFLALSVVALAIAGLFVFARTGSLLIAWSIQLLPLLQLGTYRSTLFVDPEALLVPLSLIFVTLMFVREHALSQGATARHITLLHVALGLLSGAALVTKITFAPLCLLPVVCARTWRGAACCAGATVLGAALYLVPAYSELPRIFRWFGRLATHTGNYGSGAAGFIDVPTYFTNLATLATADRLLCVVLAASLVTGGFLLVRRPGDATVARRARLLILVTPVQLFGLLLVAKHPHPRYLLPLALSSTFNVALLVGLAAHLPAPATARRALTALAVIALVAALFTGRDVRALMRELHVVQHAQLAHSHRADALAVGGVRVDYYRSSDPAFALYFGNNTAWRFYAGPLAQLHPSRIFFSFGASRFENFSGAIPPATLFRDRPIYLVGHGIIDRLPTGMSVPTPPGWELTLVERSGEFTIHRLAPRP